MRARPWKARQRPHPALAALLVLAAAQYAWNDWAQRGFWGYDEGGHAGYALSILETGALPPPLSGWSSFHPPVYYLLAAGAWAVAGAWGAQASLFALRAIASLAMLGVGAVVYALARRATASETIAVSACAVTLFVPFAQLAATMAGNEALAAAFTALALIPLLALQRDPRNLRAAALAGLCAGLAAATKYSGGWILATCALPFLRRGTGRAGLRGLALCFGLALVVAGPVYLRNLALTGTPFPFTRSLEPMKSGEERLYARPRRLSDYVVMPLDCGRYPYVTLVGPGGVWAGANPAMQRLPCSTYAGVWFDPFGLRATRSDPGEGLGWGLLLLNLGLFPTLLVVLGLVRALGASVRSRCRAPEAPLVCVTALGLLCFAAFTWVAPSLAAAKSSYLLPLLAPAGLFFASGCAWLPGIWRRAGLALSLAAAALAAYVFTTGAVFAPTNAAASRAYWTALGRQLPASHIAEAAARLVPGE